MLFNNAWIFSTQSFPLCLWPSSETRNIVSSEDMIFPRSPHHCQCDRPLLLKADPVSCNQVSALTVVEHCKHLTLNSYAARGSPSSREASRVDFVELRVNNAGRHSTTSSLTLGQPLRGSSWTLPVYKSLHFQSLINWRRFLKMCAVISLYLNVWFFFFRKASQHSGHVPVHSPFHLQLKEQRNNAHHFICWWMNIRWESYCN